MDDVRRRATMVAAIVAACALVALASRTDVADGSAAAFQLRDLRSVIGLVATVVALLSILLVAWATRAAASAPTGGRRRSWRDLVAFAIAVAMIGAMSALVEPADRRDERGVEGSVELGGERESERRADGEAPRASATGSLALAAGAVVALAIGTFVVRRRAASEAVGDGLFEGDADAAAQAAGPPSVDEVAAAVRVAQETSDPRRSITLAYRAAELALRASPLARPSTAAPREWLSFVRSRASSASSEARALQVLVGRYEIARFSDHTPTDDDRRAALDALDALAATRTA